jgi:hypothetical protein
LDQRGAPARQAAGARRRHRVENAIKAHLFRQALSIELYQRTTGAGQRGRASQFRLNALSDEALSAVLLNVLSMETIIANTFGGSRTTKKVSAA